MNACCQFNKVKKNTSKIDYDKLISNLEHDIGILKQQTNFKSAELLNRVNSTKNDLMRIKNGEESIFLQPGAGGY